MRRALLWTAVAPLALGWVGACGWNPSRPFERDAPAVRLALADLDAGEAGSATRKLEDYLSTGACKEGSIGTPELLKQRADGTFDLGLSLFRIGEQSGRRFGEEDVDAGIDEGTRQKRHAQTECARRVVDAIADDPAVSLELRARAHYLSGNLAFLDGDYQGAVHSYDRALALAPGEMDGGDPVGGDAAWNRAIALRRIDDAKDAGSPDATADAAEDGPRDAMADRQEAGSRPPRGRDAGKDASDGGGDRGNDGGSGGGGPEGGAPPPTPDGGSSGSEAGAPSPPPPSSDEDDRMLDQLEGAPTLQQEEAKHATKKRVRGMADK